MSDQIESLRKEIADTLAQTSSLDALEAVRIDALGRKGRVTALMKDLSTLAPEERKTRGQAVNALKDEITAAIEARKDALSASALDAKLAAERIDVTLTPRPEAAGTIHPISQTMDELCAIFGEMGFTLAEGPDIEDDFHNFTALNIPPEHPARQMHDTFYFEPGPDGQRKLLRTHTSPVQIRTMMSAPPPHRIIAMGRTYRCDSDMTHTPMFHQIEGLVIDRSTHMGHLKGCLIEFLSAFFEVDDVPIRLRPSYFPFTEPSCEVDIGCSRKGGELKIGAGDDWLEILGAGMVHPNVLTNCGIDASEYQGFAFGMGIERLAMLKHGIPDLRTFFEADLRWLKHYGFATLDMPSLDPAQFILGKFRSRAMKFTLAWLKEHLETERSLEDLLNGLTALGLEVEGVEDRAKTLAPFIVGHVISAEQHPNADRLRVCIVDTGREKIQVVCGAPNAHAGMKGVFAPVGTLIPGTGIELKKGVIRGVESAGMLCSARELGLGEDHDGIIELAADAPVGQSAAEVLGVGDPVIDISVTPNRGDCLGIHGIARDLAAAGHGTLKPLPSGAVHGQFKSPVSVALRLPGDAASACPVFVSRVIRNVKNGPSPEWLQKRLLAIGLRPISALVDITNYFAFDRARPLHVFDADTLAGHLHVRLSRKGEQLAALNGKTYELDDGMTVIADDDGVLSLGGVIGGESSGTTDGTKTVVLESALFDPIRTAETGRKLGIESDARYRFERWVDPASTIPGLEAATQMILDLCGGEPSDPVIAGAVPDTAKQVTLRSDRVHHLGGVDLAVDESARILRSLGFTVEQTAGALRTVTPTWRNDLAIEADLVEEVLRVHGYDNLPPVPFVRLTAMPRPVMTAAQRRGRDAKRALAARGMSEAVTYSFTAENLAALFGDVNPALKLANPISADLSVMRPSPIVPLLAAAARNVARGAANHGLFEVGPAYRDDTPAGQLLAASGLRVGESGARHWLARPRPVDAFDAKADAIAALAAAGAPIGSLQVTTDAPKWFHPGRSGTLRLGPNVLAHFGELHPTVLRAFDIKGPVVAFEVYLNRVAEPKAKGRGRGVYNPSPFQAVERDFAFLVDATVSAETILRAARGADKVLIEDVIVFDVYEGKGVDPGKKSVAISVRLQPTTATLTDAEIEAVANKIVANVIKSTGGSLRA